MIVFSEAARQRMASTASSKDEALLQNTLMMWLGLLDLSDSLPPQHVYQVRATLDQAYLHVQQHALQVNHVIIQDGVVMHSFTLGADCHHSIMPLIC